MKKILTIICSMCIILGSLSSVSVYATEDTSTPQIKGSVEYPAEVVDEYEDSLGSDFLVVTITATGFNYEKNVTSLVAQDGELTYDSSALEYAYTEDMYFPDVKAKNVGYGLNKPSFGGYAASIAQGLKANTNELVIAKLVFTVKDGVDFDEQQIEFGFKEGSLRFQIDSTDPDLNIIYGNHLEATSPMAAPSFTYGTAAAPTATITGITISPKDVETMEGGESKDFTATVTGTGAFDTAYELTASAGTITDNKTFTAPEATEVEQTITITATATGNSDIKDTVTIKVPAKVVVPDPKFEATATKSETEKYYTGKVGDVKTVQVFDVKVKDSYLKTNNWIFTFSSVEANKSRTFEPDMSAYGDADVDFQAWIVGAPADVELTIE